MNKNDSEFIDYLKMKCAKMKMRYLNAHQDDKQYHLPRKQ